MHQNQWMAAWEDLGGPKALPIPDDFPRDKEMQEVSYVFMDTSKDASVPLHDGPWTSGKSYDGRSEFTTRRGEPMGEIPHLPNAPKNSAAQSSQTRGDGMISKVADAFRD